MLATANACQLLEGMLEKGPSYVAVYLEQKFNRPVRIVDNLGFIHYPEIPDGSERVDDLLFKLAPEIRESRYFYCETIGSLIFHIGEAGASVYVIVENLPLDMVSRTVSLLDRDTWMAIKYYFANLSKLREKEKRSEKELVESLFYRSNANIRDLIKLSERELDIDKPYFVEVAQIDDINQKNDLELIRSYTLDYIKRLEMDIIPINWKDCMVVIVPAQSGKDVWEAHPVLSSLIERAVGTDRNLEVVISSGLGQVYTFPELHKSFLEARIALTLPRLMGEKGFTRRYCDLGVFSLIFSHDITALKDYCRKVLGPLIEYDDKNDGELLITLRKLLDTGINWKTTSDSLFIHVNTLHYRIKKIESILNIELSQMDTQVNLFTAIKVWDTLKTIGFLD